MAEKKLFPGVTQEELDKATREAKDHEQKSAEKDEAERKKQERKVLRNRYNTYLVNYKLFAAIYAIAFAMMAFNFTAVQKSNVKKEKQYKLEKVVSAQDTNTNLYVVFAQDTNTNPYKGIWISGIALTLVIVAAFGINAKYVKEADKAIDMMREIKENAPINLTSDQVKHLIKVVPDVISHMSAEDRKYFDLLVSGKISINDNETFKAFAVKVMSAHLEEHPEDIELVLSSFDEKSIPADFLWRCKTNYWDEKTY